MKKIFNETLILRELERLMPAKTVLLLKNLSQATFPRKNRRAYRSLLFYISAWIIFSDKLFESKKISIAHLRFFSSYLNEQLRNGFRVADPSVMCYSGMRWPYLLLKNIYAIINKSKANDKMLYLFKKAVRRFFQSMIKERKFSFEKPPHFDYYVKNGCQSIGSGPALYALGALLFARTSLSSREFDIIKQLVHRSSVILRLANDVGSREREKKAKKINSLVILANRGIDFFSARRNVLERIFRHRRIITRYQQTSNHKLRPFIRSACRLLDFNIRLYLKSDYYDKNF